MFRKKLKFKNAQKNKWNHIFTSAGFYAAYAFLFWNSLVSNHTQNRY